MKRRERRSFTDDYKRQAVDLVASSGRSVGSVAKDSGCEIRCCDAGWKTAGPGVS
jgi:transposase-like protein